MSWYIFLIPFGGQNIIWIFSNLKVSTFYKCDGLSELVAFAQNLGISQTRMDQRGSTSKWILTIFKYKNECYKQLERKK